jgi:hypothetical protein
MDTPRTLPLTLKQSGLNPPVLLLGGVDITRFVAVDGLRIEYTRSDNQRLSDPPQSVPLVTLIFAPGRLELDFEIDLLEHLLADAKAKAAG